MRIKRNFTVYFAKTFKKIKYLIISGNLQSNRWIPFIVLTLLLLFSLLQKYMLDLGLKPPDLFFIGLILAAVVYEYKAAWFLIPSLILRRLIVYNYEVINVVCISNELLLTFKWLVLLMITAFAIERYKKVALYESKLQRDLEMARVLQRSLVSKSFNIGKVSITGYIKQSFQIGGDYYYFRPFKKKYAMLAIGDVMGKGITASIVMAVIMGVFYEWGKKSLLPSTTITKINQRLIGFWGECSIFSTLFYAIFNETDMTLTYAVAGHHNGIIMPANAPASILQGEGIAVGIEDGAKWENYTLKLNTGDKLILFTDGVYEAGDKLSELYGTDRLLELIEANRKLDAVKLRVAILEDVLRFERESYKHKSISSDDKAIVILEVV